MPGASRQPTTATAVVRAFLQYGERVGIPRGQVLRTAGIDPSTMSDPDARVPLAQIEKVAEYLLSASRDPSFALHTAANLPMGEFGIVDFVIANAPDLAEGLRRLGRYVRLLTELFTLSYEETNRRAILRLVPAPGTDHLESVVADFTFGCVRTRPGYGTFGPVPLCAVRLRRDPCAHIAQLEQFFGAPVAFRCDFSALVFDLSTTHMRMEEASPHLSSILEKVGDESLARLPAASNFSARVRDVLARSLVGGAASAHVEVARRLALSPRTLQRRLKAEHVTFSQLLDDTRRQLASELLLKPDTAVAEIAYVLGFSDASAFHRAFKRWKGVTPLAYRAAHSAGRGSSTQ